MLHCKSQNLFSYPVICAFNSETILLTPIILHPLVVSLSLSLCISCSLLHLTVSFLPLCICAYTFAHLHSSPERGIHRSSFCPVEITVSYFQGAASTEIWEPYFILYVIFYLFYLHFKCYPLSQCPHCNSTFLSFLTLLVCECFPLIHSCLMTLACLYTGAASLHKTKGILPIDAR